MCYLRLLPAERCLPARILHELAPACFSGVVSQLDNELRRDEVEIVHPMARGAEYDKVLDLTVPVIAVDMIHFEDIGDAETTVNTLLLVFTESELSIVLLPVLILKRFSSTILSIIPQSVHGAVHSQFCEVGSTSSSMKARRQIFARRIARLPGRLSGRAALLCSDKLASCEGSGG